MDRAEFHESFRMAMHALSAHKLRSGLIVLGVLFLGGGWALEKLRRRLVGQVKEATV